MGHHTKERAYSSILTHYLLLTPNGNICMFDLLTKRLRGWLKWIIVLRKELIVSILIHCQYDTNANIYQMCDFSKREIISILFKRDAGNGDGLEIL